MTMPGASRALRAAGAAAALAALTAGLPAVLYAAGGTPLPHAAMSWHQLIAAAARPDSPAVVLGAVRAISWLAWAAFTACAAAERTARLRRRTARPVPGLAPLQGLAAVLVTAVLAGTTAVPARAGRRAPARGRRAAGSSAAPALACAAAAGGLPGRGRGTTCVTPPRLTRATRRRGTGSGH